MEGILLIMPKKNKNFYHILEKNRKDTFCKSIHQFKDPDITRCDIEYFKKLKKDGKICFNCSNPKYNDKLKNYINGKAGVSKMARNGASPKPRPAASMPQPRPNEDRIEKSNFDAMFDCYEGDK